MLAKVKMEKLLSLMCNYLPCSHCDKLMFHTGAHGRFFPLNRTESGPILREARIQTLEPDNWMFEVEKYGHATRKIVPQSLQDQLEEIISLGLRTVDGVPSWVGCILAMYFL